MSDEPTDDQEEGKAAAPAATPPEDGAEEARQRIDPRRAAEDADIEVSTATADASGADTKVMLFQLFGAAVTTAQTLATKATRWAEETLAEGNAKTSDPADPPPAAARPADRPAEDDNVIDLQQERRRRESPLEDRLRGSAKTAFQSYLAEHVMDDDEKTVEIDNAFVRKHGARLLVDVAASIIGNLLPDEVKARPPAEQTDEPGGTSDEPLFSVSEGGRSQDIDVTFNIDVPGLMRDLLQPLLGGAGPKAERGEGDRAPDDEPE